MKWRGRPGKRRVERSGAEARCDARARARGSQQTGMLARPKPLVTDRTAWSRRSACWQRVWRGQRRVPPPHALGRVASNSRGRRGAAVTPHGAHSVPSMVIGTRSDRQCPGDAVFAGCGGVRRRRRSGRRPASIWLQTFGPTAAIASSPTSLRLAAAFSVASRPATDDDARHPRNPGTQPVRGPFRRPRGDAIARRRRRHRRRADQRDPLPQCVRPCL